MPDDMYFALLKREDVDTTFFQRNGTEVFRRELKLTKTFEVTGDFVYTELVGKRRRSFVITPLEVIWLNRELQWVSARGPTYLSTGKVSKQSRGFASWSPRWNHIEKMPADIAKLIADHTTREFG